MKRAQPVLLSLLSIAVASCGGKATSPAAPAGKTGESVAIARGAPVFPEEPFRAVQPPPTAPRDFNLPAMKHFQLGERDKIDVYLVERHDLPTISIDLNLDGGGMVSPRARTGMAELCMEMLAEGTRKLDKIAFNEALADLASDVWGYAGDDRQGVAMATLTKSFDQTFALFVDAVTEPGMRQAELDRMIRRRLEALKQVRASPASVGGRLVGAVAYGLEHPFGRVVTEKSLQAIRLSDCKRYHQRYVKPRGARLFIVGDTTEEQVRKSFAPLLERWRGAPAKVSKPPAPEPPKGRIFFVHIPGAEQSSVSMTHAGPPRVAPDYFPTMLLAQVLGGGFASRINMNLREDKGYSYGAGGGFRYNRFFGRFGAGTAVRSDATYQSLIELRGEVAALKDGSRPPTPDELARDKEGSILALPAQFATAQSALDKYRELVYFGLPKDYYNDYVDNVRAVTAAQVQQAGAAHLAPDEARFLVIGNGDAVQIAHQKGEKGQRGQDRPLTDEAGKPLTLRAALAKLAADKTLGAGQLVELDADGRVLAPAK
jgi:zinc protease